METTGAIEPRGRGCVPHLRLQWREMAKGPLAVLCRHLVLLRGKARRFYLVHCRKEYIERQLSIRKGSCRQCATCCTLLFRCPMLTDQRLCRVYGKHRWKVCKLFPLDPRDLREVELLGGHCGYTF